MYNTSMSSVAPNNVDIMKADSGASRTYLTSNHAKYLKEKQYLHHGLIATLLNNDKIRATEQGKLSLHPQLQPQALTFPGLTNESLLSIGQLCDDDCLALFHKKFLWILKIIKLFYKVKEITMTVFGMSHFNNLQ